MRCRRIHQTGIAHPLLARYFDPATVAGNCTTPRRNVAAKLCGVIRPHHGLAAIAVLQRIRLDGGRGIHKGLLRILHGSIRTMRITTDQHRAATVDTRSINVSTVYQCDLLAQYLYVTALNSGRTDRATNLRTLAGLEHDLAALHGRAICADRTAVAHHGAEQAEAAGLGDELPDVGGIACRGGDVDSEIGIAGADQVYAVSGSQQDFAIRCSDDAGVLDIRRDQVDLSAILGGDVTGVADIGRADVGGTGDLGEVVASGEEVGVAEVEGGGDHARHVNGCAHAKDDAARVDEEHASVGLQRAENTGWVVADDAVEYGR